jgi:hypothetical protein
MLPTHIEQLLQEQISTDLSVKGTNQRDVEQRALGPWAARGGGTRPQVVKAQGLVAEVGVRAAVISGAIVKVLREVRVSPYTGLVDDLVALFESHYNVVLSELEPEITRYWHEVGLGDQRMAKQMEDFRAEQRMEVKRLGATIMEPVLKASVISISLENSQVGAIQTGDHSVVGTGIAITSRESEKLLDALDSLKKHLDAVQSGNEQKRELREIVVDVESELRKPKPNRSKISASLSWILAAIKNVEALKTAYEIIASFLSSSGIHLIT